MTRPDCLKRPVSPAPMWLRVMAKDGRATASDLATLFGYKNANGIFAAVKAEHFPAPDVAIEPTYQQGVWTPLTKRIWWSKPAIIKEYNRRIKLFKGK